MGTPAGHLKLKTVITKSTWLRSTTMLKLTLVVAAIMLHVVVSKPLDVDVKVTVNGVKIPIVQSGPEEGITGPTGLETGGNDERPVPSEGEKGYRQFGGSAGCFGASLSCLCLGTCDLGKGRGK